MKIDLAFTFVRWYSPPFHRERDDSNRAALVRQITHASCQWQDFLSSSLLATAERQNIRASNLITISLFREFGTEKRDYSANLSGDNPSLNPAGLSKVCLRIPSELQSFKSPVCMKQ
jgi:hypothetical protein